MKNRYIKAKVETDRGVGDCRSRKKLVDVDRTQKWSEVVRSGQKWSGVVRSGQEWTEVDRSGQKWSETQV